MDRASEMITRIYQCFNGTYKEESKTEGQTVSNANKQSINVSQKQSTEDEPLQKLLNNVETSLKKVIPLREGDCLGCKLVSTGGLCGMALYVVVQGTDRVNKLPSSQPTRKILYYMLTLGIAGAMGSAGMYRLVDGRNDDRKVSKTKTETSGVNNPSSKSR